MVFTSKGGKDFVVLAVTVSEGKEAINQGKPAARLAIYPADSCGAVVDPLHQVTVPEADDDPVPHDTDGC